MKKLLVVLSMAAVVAVLVAGLTGAFRTDTPAVYASRLAGISSAGTTGIQVQNLDPSQAATIVADFYDQTGGAPVSITLDSTAAGAAANIYLPNRSELKNGAYAAIISADRQIAAIARTEWLSSGGAALYSNVPPGTDVIVPLAVKDYYGQTSLVSIQNTDPSAQATVEVNLFKAGETDAVVTVQYPIGQGTSITLDLAKKVEFAAVPGGFLGSMRVTSATPIAVQSFVDFETSEMAVYAFEGVPAEEAADKLFVPLFRRNYYGTTGISVVNPGDSEVQVTANFVGSLGGCVGQSYEQGPATIAAGSSVVFYQGPGNIPGVGETPVPDNCAGAAVLEATGGEILAIVNDAAGGTPPDTSAAYNAQGAASGANTVALPLFRREFVGLTTGIQAMNIGDGDANATITFKDSTGAEITGCGQDCSKTIASMAAYTWYPPAINAISDGTYGSATIESTQPLLVIVNDASLSGQMDAAIYNGIKADVQ